MRLNSKHIVDNIVNGDTFDIDPKWDFFGDTGCRVRIANFNAPELTETGFRGAIARWYKVQFNRRIFGREVKITGAHKINRDRLVCDLEFDGRDLDSMLKEEDKTQRS